MAHHYARLMLLLADAVLLFWLAYVEPTPLEIALVAALGVISVADFTINILETRKAHLLARATAPITMPPSRLLIDGDIIAFISAAAAQSIFEDEAGLLMPIANRAAGEAIVENMLWSIKKELHGVSSKVVLSDPAANWRVSVDPSYKTNRVGPRPLLLTPLKDYLREKHGAEHWAGLEADDVLSILATEPEGDGGQSPRRVVVGRDKDFKSIPGFHHAWKQDVDDKGNMLVRLRLSVGGRSLPSCAVPCGRPSGRLPWMPWHRNGPRRPDH